MVSSARQAIACILVLSGAAIYIQAQTQSASERVATASISGKVTIKGKAAAGVTVVATDSNDQNRRRYRAKTDQTGSYRIANLPAGSYDISTITPSLVAQNESNPLVISEGENVEDIDVSLAPGGVITGKITDSEGQPIIGLPVRVMPADNHPMMSLGRTMMTRLYEAENSTDDRGVYRAFGLSQGKYKVSVGASGPGVGNSREYYKQTFYPSVTDPAKATVIEVQQGSETTNVDIVVGRLAEAFTVTGRVVDGETGKPVPNIRYGVGQRMDYGDSSSSSASVSGVRTNANGEFRLENVTPGRYTVFTDPSEQNDVPSGSVTFDVVDRNVSDLLIKTARAASLSGVVVLEGNYEKGLAAGLSDLRVLVAVEGAEPSFANFRSSSINPDGTFNIRGLPGGLAHFSLNSFNSRNKSFEIVRIERNGMPQPEKINVKEGEQVTGISLTVKYVNLTGTIRGQIKVENGELPPVSQIWLSVWPLDENLVRKPSSAVPRPQLDVRGRFVLEGLAAGTYEVTVALMPPGRNKLGDRSTQQVTVADNSVSEVTLIMKSKPDQD
jgi:Carboxypeptidase regulatory-like domain